jgi:metallo-beta-lactamase family protein
MKFTSWGAARQVTGSMHLLELASGYKILIDCGLDYELRDRIQNENFPFLPSEIDLVIVTHAHVDHSGNLPTLVRCGYEGQILCTTATYPLMQLLLADTVNIFMNDQKSKRRGKKHRHSARNKTPLYLHKHVMDAMDRVVDIDFHKPFRVNGQLSIEFIPVGHLLGAAAVVLSVEENGGQKSIAFSGDIGRKGYPVLQDPEIIPPVDYLVCESTYGGRFHTQGERIEDVLRQVIMDTCVNSPGRLIIPAFSIGRTQALIYLLNKLFQENKLPKIQVFVDSPLANAATDVYRKHQRLLNDEARAFYEQYGDEFEFDNLTYVQDAQQSRMISNYYEPCIIISSAGMLEGGRIQDHLYKNIQNFYCTIFFVGYCAKGTLGRKLLDGAPLVRINDRELSVYATIRKTDLLSGHADHEGLLEMIGQQDPARLKKIFLVHGEPGSMEAMAESLAGKGYASVAMPERGETYEL